MTRLDHDANVAPWLELAADRQLRVLHADVHSDTSLDLADLERNLTARTKVVAFPWAANSTGTVVDAKAICDLAHQASALAWVDAVQYAAHEPVDVRAVGADVVTCSAHKFCGPISASPSAAGNFSSRGSSTRPGRSRSSRSGTGSRPAPCRVSCSAACWRPTRTWLVDLAPLAPLAQLSGSASAGGELWFVIGGTRD